MEVAEAAGVSLLDGAQRSPPENSQQAEQQIQVDSAAAASSADNQPESEPSEPPPLIRKSKVLLDMEVADEVEAAVGGSDDAQIPPNSDESAKQQIQEQEPSDEPPPPCCHFCEKQATVSRCAGCREVSYCSRKCQSQHWKDHKSSCTRIEIAINAELGSHLIAARDFKAGDFVMNEKSVANGPRPQKFPYSPHLHVPTCLTCFVQTPYVCSSCHWPICSKSCQESKFHSENECPIVTEYKLQYLRPDDVDDVQVLRLCLTKARDPALWAKILTLQSDYNFETEQYNLPEAMTLVGTLQLMEHALTARKKYQIIDLVTSEEWVRMYKVTRVSGFTIPLTKNFSEANRFGGFLFIKASKLTHSCSPNCFHFVSTQIPNYQLTIRAAVDIQKGQILTITYIDTIKLFGTQTRQKELLQSAGFLCKCPRCSDRTEFKTYMSAWVCFQCTKGLSLPANPLDPTSLWICDNSDCNSIATYELIEKLTVQLRTKLSNCVKTGEYCTLLHLLDRYSGKTVHCNHWVLLESCREILSLLSGVKGGPRTDEQKVKYLEFGKRVLDIIEKIMPGVSHVSAGLKLSMSALNLERLHNDMLKDDLYLPEMNQNLDKISKSLKEAMLYFRNIGVMFGPGVAGEGAAAESSGGENQADHLIACMHFLDQIRLDFNNPLNIVRQENLGQEASSQ